MCETSNLPPLPVWAWEVLGGLVVVVVLVLVLVSEKLVVGYRRTSTAQKQGCTACRCPVQHKCRSPCSMMGVLGLHIAAMHHQCTGWVGSVVGVEGAEAGPR